MVENQKEILERIVLKTPFKWIEESNERFRIRQVNEDGNMIAFGLWLTRKGNYNINNWNKTMEEKLEVYKEEIKNFI